MRKLAAALAAADPADRVIHNDLFLDLFKLANAMVESDSAVAPRHYDRAIATLAGNTALRTDLTAQLAGKPAALWPCLK